METKLIVISRIGSNPSEIEEVVGVDTPVQDFYKHNDSVLVNGSIVNFFSTFEKILNQIGISKDDDYLVLYHTAEKGFEENVKVALEYVGVNLGKLVLSRFSSALDISGSISYDKIKEFYKEMVLTNSQQISRITDEIIAHYESNSEIPILLDFLTSALYKKQGELPTKFKNNAECKNLFDKMNKFNPLTEEYNNAFIKLRAKMFDVAGI